MPVVSAIGLMSLAQPSSDGVTDDPMEAAEIFQLANSYGSSVAEKRIASAAKRVHARHRQSRYASDWPSREATRCPGVLDIPGWKRHSDNILNCHVKCGSKRPRADAKQDSDITISPMQHPAVQTAARMH